MPYCLSCNYSLQGLPVKVCPECGRAFDPADATTVNTGRPVGAVARAFLKPSGWVTLGLGVAALGLLLYSTGVPRQGWSVSGVEWKVYRSIDYAAAGQSKEEARALLNRLSIPFLAGALLTGLLVLLALVRIAGRVGVIVWCRPGRALRPRLGFRRVLSGALMLACILLLMFGWPVRVASMWTRDTDAKLPRIPLNDRERLLIHRAGIMDLPTVEMRSRALHQMLLSCYAESRVILEAAVERERDAELRSAMLMMLGLHRDSDSLETISRQLDDADPRVRAAAIDAMGIVYAPAHAVESEQHILLPSGDKGEAMACSLEPLFRAITGQTAWSYPGPRLDMTPRTMPADMRERLTQRMLSGASPEERQAAARALVMQRPEGYQLRIAEWGVWLAAGDRREVAAAIEDIPPFVHRTGNPAAEFAERIRPSMMIVNKPVIHITASKPLVLDLEVLIREGRPWFAYPRPDDFTIHVVPLPARLDARGTLVTEAGALPPLDDQSIPPLGDLHEGYPLVFPGHRFHNVDPHLGLRAIADLKTDTVQGLGLRWQSLIVSPGQLPWMKLAEVGEEDRFGWWTRLREVPCSYVSSRNEAERFLYYDGPSQMRPPVVVRGGGSAGRIAFEVEPPENVIIEEAREQNGQTPAQPKYPSNERDYRLRRGMAIAVGADGGLTVYRHAIPKQSGEATLKTDAAFRGEQAISQFLEMLREGGLNEAEARGLLACWRKSFFERPGTRFVLMMSGEDYDRACPMQVSMPPTAIARVGLILTEL